MMTAAFFHPLQSHGRGITKTSFPQKCSSVITSIYVDANNPRTFRCGIRAFYNQEKIMKAQEAIDQLEAVISDLDTVKGEIEANDTYEFDIGRKLNLISALTEEISDYVADQT